MSIYSWPGLSLAGERCRRVGRAGLVALATVGSLGAQTITVTSDHADGVYHVGDTVHWSIQWTGTAAAPTAHYVVKDGGYTEVARGDLQFAAGTAHLDTKFDQPNSVLLEVDWDSGNKAFGGAVAQPELIQPAAPEPADFDAFWQARLAELAAVPANPQLAPADSGRPDVSYWTVIMDNIRGTHIEGQIARPTTGATFPALLILQYAGVYGLQKSWVTDRAAEGWLALNINPHDLPIDQPDAYYQQQASGPLANYWNIGNDDPNTSYYLRMYLSCVRAIDYLRSRPDWDGKTLVVVGASQGGQQTFAALGLHPDGITAGLVLVPAACDMLAPEVGRATGYPYWYANTAGKDPAQVRSASRYYDPINFARRIRCPMLIGIGLYDTLAPPSSILAAANVMTAPREVLLLESGHTDVPGSQLPYAFGTFQDWLADLRSGQMPVLNPYPAHPTQIPVPTGDSNARIVNLSSRGIVAAGAHALIAGFHVSGSTDKKLLILADGLNLTRFGVTGEIGRPHLSLYRATSGGNVLVTENNDWQTDAAAVSALINQVHAQPLTASGDPGHGDAALVVTLSPGTYSAMVSPDALSANQDGIGLVELYDATPSDDSRLTNISTRGVVENGARQMIVGVVTSGSGATRLLVRGVGPALAPYLAEYLRNPAQTLYQNVSGQQTILMTNDDWWNSVQGDQAAALAPVTGAFPLAPYSADSAVVQRVGTGTYSIIISPDEGTTGIALAEVYEAN